MWHRLCRWYQCLVHGNWGSPLEKPLARRNIQLFWGIAYILAGFSVFYNLHRRLPEIVEFSQSSGFIWSIRIAFYLVGIILIGGGIFKVLKHFKHKQADHSQNEAADPED